MYQIKPISREAIPRAIQKAERYRLLNQSWAAESICLDVLAVEPDNQQVLVMMVLALTDLHSGVAAAGVKKAKEYLARITDDYQRAYYSGMVSERRGRLFSRRGEWDPERLPTMRFAKRCNGRRRRRPSGRQATTMLC